MNFYNEEIKLFLTIMYYLHESCDIVGEYDMNPDIYIDYHDGWEQTSCIELLYELAPVVATLVLKEEKDLYILHMYDEDIDDHPVYMITPYIDRYPDHDLRIKINADTIRENLIHIPEGAVYERLDYKSLKAKKNSVYGSVLTDPSDPSDEEESKNDNKTE